MQGESKSLSFYSCCHDSCNWHATWRNTKTALEDVDFEDRLGRSLHHLINTVHDLTTRGIGFKVLTGHGASIDTTTPSGKLVFGIFAALAEFEREIISERTKAGLASARSRGRKGGAPFKMTAAKLRLAMAAMGKPETKVSELCRELGITRQTLYRHISPDGSLRTDGKKLISS